MVKQLLVFIFCCLFANIYAQQDNLFCKQLEALQNRINKSHYSPKPIDDSLSVNVFDLFITKLDEHKRFFRQTDIDDFKKDEFQIDDYLIDNSCGFVDKYAETLKKRIESSKQIVESFRNKSFDYSGKDTLYFTPNKDRGYFKNEASAISYWNKRLRYLIISKIIEEDSVIETINRNFKRREAELKPKIIDNQLCLLDELLHQNTNFDTYVKEMFLNALINYEDPNSSFFNMSEKTEFEGSLSNNQLTFGIETDKSDEGEIKIIYVLPGSPAFKNGSIEENQTIISMNSGKDLLEAFCVSNDDVLAFMNDDKHQTISFKIKKSNGAIEDIELTKSITKVESNTIRGYIIENTLDVGYIKIPSFYTDLESPNGLGVANDFAKELFKLNQENIKGLIIDLRFNGGGSMKEAAELSGMFIDRGPLSIIKYATGETFTIRDMNRGTLFNKPIIVLINNYSASASEFFAAVMQDYGRAVIVGSPSHGKSSAQVILPLSETEDLGFSKITVEKFYRITGLSHQSLGVIPDVMIPSLYDNFKTGEGFEKFALKNDSVSVSMKFKTFKPIQLETLKINSSKRISDNINFKVIKEMNSFVLENYIDKTTKYPLTVENIYSDLKNYNSMWEKFNSQLEENLSDLLVRNTSSTSEILQYNQEDLQVNESILDEIVNDIYIEEAYTILIDLLNSKTTN